MLFFAVRQFTYKFELYISCGGPAQCFLLIFRSPLLGQRNQYKQQICGLNRCCSAVGSLARSEWK
jgi:hypothetical protein